MINNPDPDSQIENDERPVARYPNESDTEKRETNKNSAIPYFKSQILPDEEIAEVIVKSNSKQREIHTCFNVVHTWTKDYVKYDRHNVKPIHIFLSGSGATV